MRIKKLKEPIAQLLSLLAETKTGTGSGFETAHPLFQKRNWFRF